jgi:dihydroxy-acid dehydratase
MDHISPEAAEDGAIARIKTGDRIEIDIPERTIWLAIGEGELDLRRERMKAGGAPAWQPAFRPRQVSAALQAYDVRSPMQGRPGGLATPRRPSL